MGKYRSRRLKPEEHMRTREVYEEIFPEDSKEFVDYYYECKGKNNKIYVIEQGEEISSMLHLNPYAICLGTQRTNSYYIVAVATKEKDRHKGMMRQLLEDSMRDMREENIPFTFLMPASAAIYEPFDFRFIYEQRRGKIFAEKKRGIHGFVCRPAQSADLWKLAEFGMTYWSSHARVCALHTEQYFRNLQKEQTCQKGEVVLVERTGEIVGYFFWAKEEKTEVREAVLAEEYQEFLPDILFSYLTEDTEVILHGFSGETAAEEDRVPLMMARVLSPEAFVKGLRSHEPVTLEFWLEDSFLPENTGAWELCVHTEGAHLKKMDSQQKASKEKLPCLEASVFTELFFGRIPQEDSRFPQEWKEIWGKIEIYSPTILNEIV